MTGLTRCDKSITGESPFTFAGVGEPSLGKDHFKSLNSLSVRPQIRQDYPLNLSISISGGKETNKDSPSNGE